MGTIRKKYVVRGLLIFLLVSFTPLYDFLLGGPAVITISGQAPPDVTKVRGVSAFMTDTPWCRDFSMGSGSFTATGTRTTRVETEVNADGTYCLRVPMERKSFWCDWWEIGGVDLYGLMPLKAGRSMPRRIKLAQLLFSDEAPQISSLEMECVDTYYLANEGVLPPFNHCELVMCRPSKHSYPPDKVEFSFATDAPRIRLSLALKALEVNIRLLDGPVFESRKGVQYFWEEFDREREEKGL